MKDYSFKLYDEKFIGTVERWIEEGYTIRGMVEELLAKYEGLQVPKPNEIQLVNIEIRALRKEIEILKKNESTMLEIIKENIDDIEALKACTESLLQSSQHHQTPPNSQVAAE